MSYLWALIQSLQMFVYLPLFNVTLPANLQVVFAALIKVATFDVLPYVEEIQELLFTFSEAS